MPHPFDSAPARAAATPPSGGHSTKPAAFTLVELLVAIAIASLLMWLAVYLFNTTQRATRAGLEISTAINQAYLTELRMRTDEAGILGPDARDADPYTAADFRSTPKGSQYQPWKNGMLVIVPGVRKGFIPVRNDGGPVSGPNVTTNGTTLYRQVNLRSDQLAFFYDADTGGTSATHIGPGLSMRSLTVPGAASPTARIWYGHVRQPMPNESDLADHWTLGRDALLFNPNLAATPSPTPVPGFADPATAVPATGPGKALQPSPDKDLSDYRLDAVMDWLRGQTTASLPDADAARLVTQPQDDKTNYQSQPEVNLTPLENQTLEFNDDVTGPRLAMASHCSEFIVQFAMDWDCNGWVDTVNHGAWGKNAAGAPSMSNGDGSGQLAWFPPDTDINNGGAPAVPGPYVFRVTDGRLRSIRFGYRQDGKNQPYTLAGDWATEVDSGHPLYYGPGAKDADGNPYPAHYVIPEKQCGWPRLVRIRYRLHDPNGDLFSVDDTMLANKRDDNGDGKVDEPGENRCAGIWFEHVFATPYPINPPFVMTPP